MAAERWDFALTGAWVLTGCGLVGRGLPRPVGRLMRKPDKEPEEVIYFAYGSNMLECRIKGRTPSAEAVGVGRLEGMKVVMNKRGADGSGKANLMEDPEGVTYGVLYRIDSSEIHLLDDAERGYERRTVVVYSGGELVGAQTYISDDLTDVPVAYDWYKDIILNGAREHGLPEDHIGYLESLPSKPSESGNTC